MKNFIINLKILDKKTINKRIIYYKKLNRKNNDLKYNYKKSEKNTFINLISNNKVMKEDIKKVSSHKMKKLLSHYIEFNKSIIY